MGLLFKRQLAIEEKFEKLKSTNNAIALIENYWLNYKITDDVSLLHKAYHITIVMGTINFSNIDIYLYNIFLNSELGNDEKALESIERLKPNRVYYKNNEPKIYAKYIFLLSLVYDRMGKKRLAQKQYEVLLGLNASIGNEFCDVFLAMLNNEQNDYDKVIDFVANAYKNGNRSIFVFNTALECFVKAPKTITKFDEALFFGLIKWAMNKNIDIGQLIQKFRKVSIAYFTRYRQLFKEIYNRYPSKELLERICIDLMEKMDYSPQAFYYYKDAEAKQLELPDLYEFIIKTANINGDEKINQYTVSRFLKQQTADRELLAFVFHIIITKNEDAELLKEYFLDIMEFSAESLRKSQSGRYYNTIYQLFIKNDKSDKELVLQAEKLLYEDLFKFRIYIDNNKIKYIWIFAKELKQTAEYVLVGKTRIIVAANTEFSCKFFDEEKRNIIDASYKMVRLVENADIDLYKRYFDKGLLSTELLIALSNYYMSFEEFSDGSIEVFKMTLANRDISPSYRMLINATIGNYYAALNDYKRASIYYKDVNENTLNDRYIEQMLMTYIKGKEYDKAVSLIVKKAECISDRNLFYSLKQIVNIKSYNKDIADVAYELTLKSWYDKALVKVVFEHYNGSQEEWQALSNALMKMSVSERSLDEIILKNALWMRIFDKGSQSIFWRMYEMDKDNILIEEFSIFSTYEIIINGKKPEYETIEILEKMFMKKMNHFIGYALCHVYINHDITTFKSEFIIEKSIENCENDKQIFPIFKRLKDKSLLSSYIESNQPFIYRGFPNRKIKFYYKVDGEMDFKSKKMKYVKFGLYFVHIPSFYGETISYYFSEEMETGSIITKQESIENKNMILSDDDANYYCAINNALIYEQLFKYDKVEEIITERLKEKPRIKGWIL